MLWVKECFADGDIPLFGSQRSEASFSGNTVEKIPISK